MHLGTPHTLVHAAGPEAAARPDRPELDATAPEAVEPAERVIVVQEPALPDHVDELVGETVDEPSEAAT